MNIRDFIKYELIGLEVEVLNKGIRGKIIDETKNTFLIETENGKKLIQKKNNTFLFFYKNFWILIKGDLMIGRPWERIKKKIIKKL